VWMVLFRLEMGPASATRAETKGACEMKIDKLYIRRAGDPSPALVASHSSVRALRLTLDKFELSVTDEMSFDDGLINGKPNPPDAKTPGADLQSLIKTVIPEFYQSHFHNP